MGNIFDSLNSILIFSGILLFILGVILIDYLNRKKKDKHLIRILIIFFSSIPINLISQFIYYKTIFENNYAYELGQFFKISNFEDFFISIFYQYFSLKNYYIDEFNPRWIFLVINSILTIIIIYYLIKYFTPKGFRISQKEILKYALLLIITKPILTYLIYPLYYSTRIKGSAKSGKRYELGYHIENIFEYEPITFIYSFILMLMVYLFINPKKKTKDLKK